MKLLIESAIIFFGTLLAAGLLALGEPARTGQPAAKEAAVMQAVNQLLESSRPLVEAVPMSTDLGR
jgi:hypothetical protein